MMFVNFINTKTLNVVLVLSILIFAHDKKILIILQIFCDLEFKFDVKSLSATWTPEYIK